MKNRQTVVVGHSLVVTQLTKLATAYPDRVKKLVYFVVFNDTATTEIYTLSLHDALPISTSRSSLSRRKTTVSAAPMPAARSRDRKSTRLNSSHVRISYAVFCLKKKK